MRQSYVAAGAFAALLSLAGAAQAAPGGRLTHLPAGTLLRICQSPQSVKVCDAYISGIADGITLVETAAGPTVARKVCIPGVSGAQLRGAVVPFLSRHSDRMSSDVGPVVFDALAQAFPCGGAGAGSTP